MWAVTDRSVGPEGMPRILHERLLLVKCVVLYL